MKRSHRNEVSRILIGLFAMLGMLSTFSRPAVADEPRHEKIDAARQVLKDAYIDLDKADDDFGGHKKEAMEKIDQAAKSLEKWHDNISDASDKLDKALEQLHVCKEKGRERHPKIEEAISAVEAAKVELSTIQPPHAKIDAAKVALEDAYRDLDKAADDFGGHKKEAMEKVSDAKHTLDSWSGNVQEATDKIDKALEQLQICKDKSKARHPKIEQAIDALQAAKDEIK
jgi:chromosome segregation ATPase